MTISFSFFLSRFNRIQRLLYPRTHIVLLLWNKNFSVEFKISWRHQSSPKIFHPCSKNNTTGAAGLRCWFLSFPVTPGRAKVFLNSLLLLFLPRYYAMSWHEGLIWGAHRWEGSGKSIFSCQVSPGWVWHCSQCFPCPTVPGVGLLQMPKDHIFSSGLAPLPVLLILLVKCKEVLEDWH